MKTLSTTQIANYTAFAGIIVMVSGKFGLDLQAEDVVTAIGAIVTLGGIVHSYWNRYKKGDVTLGGKFKE